MEDVGTVTHLHFKWKSDKWQKLIFFILHIWLLVEPQNNQNWEASPSNTWCELVWLYQDEFTSGRFPRMFKHFSPSVSKKMESLWNQSVIKWRSAYLVLWYVSEIRSPLWRWQTQCSELYSWFSCSPNEGAEPAVCLVGGKSVGLIWVGSNSLKQAGKHVLTRKQEEYQALR